MAERALGGQGSAGRMIRSVESLRFGPLWLGLGLGLALGLGVLYVASFVAVDAVDHRYGLEYPLFLDSGTRIHTVVAFLTAFVFATGRYESQRWRADLGKLRALTRCSDSEWAAIVPGPRPLDRRRLGSYAGIGLLLGYAVFPATTGDLDVLRPQAWNGHVALTVLTNALLLGLVARDVHVGFAQRRQLERSRGRSRRSICSIAARSRPSRCWDFAALSSGRGQARSPLCSPSTWISCGRSS